MEWTVVHADRDSRTERAVTDTGEVLFRSAWFIPSLRPGIGQSIGFGFAAVAEDANLPAETAEAPVIAGDVAAPLQVVEPTALPEVA